MRQWEKDILGEFSDWLKKEEDSWNARFGNGSTLRSGDGFSTDWGNWGNWGKINNTRNRNRNRGDY